MSGVDNLGKRIPPDEEMTRRIKEVRRRSIEGLIEAAKKMLDDPDNYDHIGQVYYCVRNYEEAQMILNPRFFR